VAKKIRELINRRRKNGLPDLDDDALSESNLEELRQVALMRSRSYTSTRIGKVLYRARCLAIKLYVLRRADGHCEYCDAAAPFLRPDGAPYLEPHHTTRLADEGPDHPAHVIALCPNCHRRAHHATDATAFNQQLKKVLRELESR
jgi:5-methylcytosine-specific restriction protein A